MPSGQHTMKELKKGDTVRFLSSAIDKVTNLITQTVDHENKHLSELNEKALQASHQLSLENLKADWQKVLVVIPQVISKKEDGSVSLKPEVTREQIAHVEQLLNDMFASLDVKVGRNGNWVAAPDEDARSVLLSMNHVSLWWKAVIDEVLDHSERDPYPQFDKCTLFEESEYNRSTKVTAQGQMSREALSRILFGHDEASSALREPLVAFTMGESGNSKQRSAYTDLLGFSSHFAGAESLDDLGHLLQSTLSIRSY